MGEYPEHTNTLRMLDRLYQELSEAHERKEVGVRLQLITTPPRTGLYVYRTSAELGQAIGVNGAEAVSLFKILSAEGVISVTLDSSMRAPYLNHLTRKGLIEIGKLPDPEERFFMGIAAAIQTIQEDDRLSEDDKRRGIDWIKEGRQMGRVMLVEVFKAMLRGNLPPF